MRVRFAPSPTGYLHVGGARTALFNWLLARRHGGVFILRVEDTDRERSSAAMTDAILDGLSWLGLTWDEGPFHQADGFERHRRDALKLLDSGAAYRCFCSAELLERKRAAAEATDGGYGYDRTCRSIARIESDARAASGEAFTIRFAVPDGETWWDDAVHGRITIANSSIDDFIILRSDGTPIYNLAVVSDDAEMRITHVIRGDDHISNTPKQILLYRALGFPVPVFAHVPMILGPDGKRLSKRHGATAIGEYRDQGILPDAMVNFLALLGWSPGGDQEILSREDLIARFSLDGINRKSAIFDPQKLEWMNAQYISRMSASDLAPLVAADLKREYGVDFTEVQGETRAWFLALIDLLKPRARVIGDIARQARPYVTTELVYDDEAVRKHWKNPAETRRNLSVLRERLEVLPKWDTASLEATLRETAESLGVGAGKLIHPLRVALTGAAVSPGIFEVAAVMGRDRTLQRITAALEELSAREAGAA